MSICAWGADFPGVEGEGGAAGGWPMVVRMGEGEGSRVRVAARVGCRAGQGMVEYQT